MKNEKLIIKKIIKNYIWKFARRDIELRDHKQEKYFDSEKKYFNYLNTCNLATLLKELYFGVSYNKKQERKYWSEYYETIWKNYYWWDL